MTVLEDLFSVNLTKGGNYEESHVSIDNSNSIMQPKTVRLKDIKRVIIGNFKQIRFQLSLQSFKKKFLSM